MSSDMVGIRGSFVYMTIYVFEIKLDYAFSVVTFFFFMFLFFIRYQYRYELEILSSNCEQYL